MGDVSARLKRDLIRSMSDALSLIFVLGGSAIAIGLIVLLNVILGGAGMRRFANIDDALKQLGNANLDFEPSHALTLSDDGAALLCLDRAGERLALGIWMGDRAVFRFLRPGQIRSVEDDEASLVLTVSDYSFRPARIRLSESATRSDWFNQLQSFTG